MYKDQPQIRLFIFITTFIILGFGAWKIISIGLEQNNDSKINETYLLTYIKQSNLI